jgi:hypothetical protein
MTDEMQPKQTEEELLQESKDDPAEWGAPIPATRGRRLSAVVSVRFTPAELELIRDATADGNISQFLREAGIKAATSQPMRWTPTESTNTSSGRGANALLITANVEIADPTETSLQVMWSLPSATKSGV